MQKDVEARLSTDNWFPIYREISEIIGVENAIKFYEHFHGLSISYPMKMFTKEGIVNVINEEYNAGSSVKEISSKYGYSIRHINRIVSKQKRGEGV